MKVFLHIFLYLSVSVCSLFFVIWFLTSSPFVGTAEAADPDNTSMPSVKEKEAEPVKGGADVNSPSAPEAAGSNSGDVTDSASTSPPIPPPPPLPDNKDSASGEPSPPDILENKDSASVEPVPAPPVPETTGERDSLTEMLESNDQFHEDKGSNKEMVKGLMDLNKKVVDMYKMLSDYQYDMTDRRDPFAPFKEAKEVEEKKAFKDTRKCFGEKHNLNDIKLVGIKWGAKVQPRALFKTPANDISLPPLQKNDCLGRSKATIYKIEEGRVVVIESRTLNPDKISNESAFALIEISISRGERLVSK